MPKNPYKYVKRKNHPLSTPSGRIPEHRLVLWEKIGPGPHPCHRCGVLVDWNPGSRTKAGSLVTDHLDEDQSNNSPENLEPACQRCNLIRGRDKRFEGKPFIITRGVRELAVERECATCCNKFLIAKKHLKKARPGFNVGTYCSRRCMHDRPRG